MPEMLIVGRRSISFVLFGLTTPKLLAAPVYRLADVVVSGDTLGLVAAYLLIPAFLASLSLGASFAVGVDSEYLLTYGVAATIGAGGSRLMLR